MSQRIACTAPVNDLGTSRRTPQPSGFATCWAHSATAPNENFQILPRPVVHFVAGLRRRGFVARFIRVPFQQEVWHFLFLSNFKLVANPSGGVGVLTADDDHLLAFLD